MFREYYLPFGMPVEISENIFNNLVADDLLECLLVSKNWQNLILNSKCFHKIALHVDEDVDLDILLHNNRMYRTLRIFRLNKRDLIKCLETYGTSVSQLDINDCLVEKVVGQCLE